MQVEAALGVVQRLWRAGVAHCADDLALGHVVADLQPVGDAAQVGVAGDEPVAVVQPHLPPSEAVQHVIRGVSLLATGGQPLVHLRLGGILVVHIGADDDAIAGSQHFGAGSDRSAVGIGVEVYSLMHSVAVVARRAGEHIQALWQEHVGDGNRQSAQAIPGELGYRRRRN